VTPEGSFDLAPNARRFTGFADLYDTVRPTPPDELAEVLMQYCGRSSPDVVDLGSGTGLSTRWAARWAGSVTGVEPSPDMRAAAEAKPSAGVRYVSGYAHETGLPDDCADVVLAVQAFHWMEPIGTLAEVARVARPGAVFAAVDCDWPPTVGSAEVERAWAECRKRLRVYEARVAGGAAEESLHAPVDADDRAGRGYSGRDAHRDRTLAWGVQSWSKDSHLDSLRSSGHFAWCHELAMHKAERGDAQRFVDLFRSQGDYQTLRHVGFEDAELGIARLDDTARRCLGDREVPWWFTYRAQVGVLPR